MAGREKHPKRGAPDARGVESSSASTPPSTQKPAPPAISERRWEGLSRSGGLRVDKYVAEVEHVLTRSQLKARSARVLVNGRPERLSCKLKVGDRIELFWNDEPSHDFSAEHLPLAIIYEDENVFVIDKAQGMVTHPANGNWSGTVANAILGLEVDRAGRAKATDQAESAAPGAISPVIFGTPAASAGTSEPAVSGGARSPDLHPSDVPLSGANFSHPGTPRGGIVHRLDKDTSGVLIVARNTETQAFLSDQFRNRQTRKLYVAILQGQPPAPAGRVDNHLGRDKRNRKKFASSTAGGRRAITDYTVVSRWAIDGVVRYSVVLLYPRTGRTHQLRVHMAEMNCPILGDPLYGRKDRLIPEATLMLHAHKLKIKLPGHADASLFTAPIPERFHAGLAIIKLRCRRMK